MLMTANSLVHNIFTPSRTGRRSFWGLARPLAIVVASTLLLAACSDSNSGSGTTSPAEDDTSTENAGPRDPLAIPVPNRLGGDSTHIGLGPAFAAGGERPSVYEDTNFTKTGDTFKTGYDGYTVSFTTWERGTATLGTAGAIRDFLQSFRVSPDGDATTPTMDGIVIPDVGMPKTIHISGFDGNADEREQVRELVIRVVRLLNAALPHAKRIMIPTDLFAAPGGTADIITIDLKGDDFVWPENVAYSNGEVEVLGKAIVSDDGTEAYTVTSGLVYVNKEAFLADPASFQLALTRQLLLAYGLVAHAEADKYPQTDAWKGTDIYTDLEGEVLLAVVVNEVLQQMQIGSLPNNFDWDTNATHVRGVLDIDGDDGTQTVEFGAGFLNGLAKPWAIGSIPGTTLDETFADKTSATWNGHLLGFNGAGQVVTGKTAITINDFTSTTENGTAAFTDFEIWEKFQANDRTEVTDAESAIEDINYDIKIVGGGNDGDYRQGFVNINSDGDLSGVFVGENHEGVIGTLERSDVSAAFGAKLDGQDADTP